MKIVVGYRSSEMARVLVIASCDDNEVDSLERVQIGGDELIERLSEMNVGAWQLRSGKGESTTRLSSGSRTHALLGRDRRKREKPVSWVCPVMSMRSSGTLRGRSVSAMYSFATQNRSVWR